MRLFSIPARPALLVAMLSALLLSGCAAADAGGPFFLGVFVEFFSFLKLCMIGGFTLAFVFLALLALPRSPLRDFVMQFLLWGVSAVCAFFVVSPLDLIPFLPFDDLLALGGGLTAATGAVAQKLRQRREDREKAMDARRYAYTPRPDAEYGCFGPTRGIGMPNHSSNERTRHEHTTER